MENNFIYSLKFKVRDYECDLQGIVNNAVYLNYFEHTRHEFLNSTGINFAFFHRIGLDLVIARAEIEYLKPLKSQDEFLVTLNINLQGKFKIWFLQEIFKIPDYQLITKAKFKGACIKNGKPFPLTNILKKIVKKYPAIAQV